MTVDRYQIYWVVCDKNGRPAECCGHRNSSGTNSRPFMIVSTVRHNRTGNEEIYALPMTTKGRGNTFSIPVTSEVIMNIREGFEWRDTNLCCDKLCRIKRENIETNRGLLAVLRHNVYKQAKSMIYSYLQRNPIVGQLENN